MARVRDPDLLRRKILFGDAKHPVQIERMARDTKIPESTLFRYKKYPSSIPFDKLIRIVKWNGLDDKQIGELFK